MDIDLVFDGKCLTVKDGVSISLAAISEMHIVSDTECSYKIGEDTVTFTCEWDSNGDMVDLQLEHSLATEASEQETIQGTITLTQLGKNIIIENGWLQSDVQPQRLDNLSENKNIKIVMYYENDTVTLTGVFESDELGKEVLKDLKLEIDGYEGAQSSESDGDNLTIVLSAFRYFFVCENGDLSDSVLPDKIHTVSDHEFQFIYGDDVKTLTFEWDGDDKIKNVQVV